MQDLLTYEIEKSKIYKTIFFSGREMGGETSKIRHNQSENTFTDDGRHCYCRHRLFCNRGDSLEFRDG